MKNGNVSSIEKMLIEESVVERLLLSISLLDTISKLSMFVSTIGEVNTIHNYTNCNLNTLRSSLRGIGAAIRI